MIAAISIMIFLAVFGFVLGLGGYGMERRPTLQSFGYDLGAESQRPSAWSLIRTVALVNRPLVLAQLRKRYARDLARGHVDMTPEEFLLLKEISILAVFVITAPFLSADKVPLWILISLIMGYYLPETWLKGRINRVRNAIIRELPDTIDLLGLCVNAGLDFMLALKWVVEKSPPSIMVNELNILLQEINVGKTRRDALKDLAARYDIPDLATFTRTLIQADKMGTSVSEALNQLSEDMRLARFRRGEQIAMKAPLKLLIPLMFFIFPVVGVLVVGPVLLQFIETNPLEGLAGRKQQTSQQAAPKPSAR